MFTYATCHLISHATGLFLLDSIERIGHDIILPWRTPFGLSLLLAAFLTHLGLGLWALYRRRHLRMPAIEAWQLGLGLTIPLLLAPHVADARLGVLFYGLEDSYFRALYVFWVLEPLTNLSRQLALLIAVWTHGCIGIHMWLQLRAVVSPPCPLVRGRGDRPAGPRDPRRHQCGLGYGVALRRGARLFGGAQSKSGARRRGRLAYISPAARLSGASRRRPRCARCAMHTSGTSRVSRSIIAPSAGSRCRAAFRSWRQAVGPPFRMHRCAAAVDVAPRAACAFGAAWNAWLRRLRSNLPHSRGSALQAASGWRCVRFGRRSTFRSRLCCRRYSRPGDGNSMLRRPASSPSRHCTPTCATWYGLPPDACHSTRCSSSIATFRRPVPPF